jgi:hypothetical protein
LCVVVGVVSIIIIIFRQKEEIKRDQKTKEESFDD